MGFGDVKLALLMGLYLGWLGWTPVDARPRPAAPGPLRADARLLRRRRLRDGPRRGHPPPGGVPLRPGAGPGLHHRRHLAAVAARLPPSARTRSSSGRRRAQGDPWPSRRNVIRWPRGRPWPTGCASAPAPPTVEVGEVTIPGLSGFSNETLLFDATWDDGDGPGHPRPGDPRRAERPHGVPEHRVRPPGAGAARPSVPRAACRCPRSSGSSRTPPCWATASWPCAGSRARSPRTRPSYHQEGWFPGAHPRAPRPRCGPAGSTRWGPSTASTARPSASAAIEARTPAEQLALDHEYRALRGR